MRALLLTALLACACGPIDPAPITDADGNEIVFAGAFDTPLGAAARYPEVVGERPVLRFVFDGFLDEDGLLDFGVVTVQSGGLSTGGRVTWEMSTRTLEFRPFSDLVPGFVYRPVFDAGRLFSVTGAPFRGGNFPPFRVDPDAPAGDAPSPRDVEWTTIDALFEARCRSCHADPGWDLNPLTHASLVGSRSEQVDGLLVVPFDPGDSYLLHKLIADYPVRRFTAQPPPWSGAEPLSDAEVRLVEHWIATGARD